MPSLAIHLAITKRYTELHPNKISDLNNFYKGSIAPDLNDDFSKILSKPEKAITHYYLQPRKDKTNFNLFRQDKKVDLANDYWKGYYAHLLADHLFYMSYFKQEVKQSIKNNENLYEDFSILAAKIIKDYHPKLDNSYITGVVKQHLITKNGGCKYLNYSKVHNFIEEISANLDQLIQDIS